ncbi:MAG: STAS/SEC14 domain-containing protein [Gammaproteobacteria bacterium]|nr:STAS/SEC14 domain-containing protein [Gammaproteobacteria bacterium]
MTITVSGMLAQSELTQVQQAAADIIRAHGKVRILVLAGDFAGWERGGDWADFSFQETFDPYIEKMAIVGDTRWEDLTLIFVAKGLRSFPIEYFASGELDRAQAWLKQ